MINKKKLEKWILSNWINKDYLKLDSIHIDEIDNFSKQQKYWFEDSLTIFICAVGIKNIKKLPCLIALCFSLRSTERKIGVNFETASQLTYEFDQTPPSLYLFKKNQSEWLDTPKIKIKLGRFQNLPNNTKYYYSEYRDSSDFEFRRSVWFLNDHLDS